jgi:hypothetical protein
MLLCTKPTTPIHHGGLRLKATSYAIIDILFRFTSDGKLPHNSSLLSSTWSLENICKTILLQCMMLRWLRIDARSFQSPHLTPNNSGIQFPFFRSIGTHISWID